MLAAPDCADKPSDLEQAYFVVRRAVTASSGAY
jgi:hypothetical protein